MKLSVDYQLYVPCTSRTKNNTGIRTHSVNLSVHDVSCSATLEIPSALSITNIATFSRIGWFYRKERINHVASKNDNDILL